MDIEHCVIAELSSEVARFRIAADKRRYNVLSICPVAHPSPLRASECLTLQIYKIILIHTHTNKNCNAKKHIIAHIYNYKSKCYTYENM